MTPVQPPLYPTLRTRLPSWFKILFISLALISATATLGLVRRDSFIYTSSFLELADAARPFWNTQRVFPAADWSMASLPLDAPLDSRLAAWASVATQTAEDWHVRNLRTCPPHQNKDFLLKGYTHKMMRSEWPELWSKPRWMNTIRRRMVSHLQEAQRVGLMNVDVHGGRGKGIVFSAGKELSLRRVMTSVRLLRYHYGCQLPAEVFHFQDEQPSESVLKELEALNVSVLALNTLKMQSDNRAYHLKASAILESSFREVLFLDSDNFPAADLTPLFESKAYQRLGATFWPDYWKESPVNPIWQIIGVQCRDEFSQESGIFLIDKNVHLDVLRLVEWMLEHRKYFYKLSMGDKDLFRFAMLALRKRWAVPGRHLSTASWDADERGVPFCGMTMVQHDTNGQPVTVHGNMVKNAPSSIHFRAGTDPPEPIWGKTLRITRHTTDADDLDADHLANVNLSTGAGLQAHWNPAVAERNYADAGARAYFKRVEQVGRMICAARKWEIPGGEDARAKVEQKAMLKGARDEEVVPLLHGQSAFEEVLWRDDERLRDFEKRFREEGGFASGAPHTSSSSS